MIENFLKFKSGAGQNLLLKCMAARAAFWSAIILFGCAIDLQSQTRLGIEITGSCESDSWTPNGNKVGSNKYGFTVNLFDQSWSIRLENDKQRKLDGFDYVEAVFDGVDLYRVAHFPPTNSPKKASISSHISNESYESYGTVTTDTFSKHGTPVEQILWLAFCSENYLPLTKANFPAIDLPLFQKDNIGKVDVDYTETLPRLPKTIHVLVNGMYGFSPKDHKFKLIALPAPYDVGFNAFDFVSSSPILHNSSSVPQNIVASFYMVNPPNLFRSTEIKVVVGKVVSLTEGIKLPKLQGMAAIVDSRIVLSNKMPLRYVLQNGTWLSRNGISNPDVLEHTTKMPVFHGESYLEHVNVRPMARLSVLAAMVVLTIIFIIFSFRFQNNKKQK